ncbi:MAG: c-type cytochrome [Candidatus Lambdaproteobacteria bacterium]|nr:c-type cytochrome [Candidatus Lambdaproteobacteria bacterium]
MASEARRRALRKTRSRWAPALAAALLTMLGGCLEADTRGDEPPDEVHFAGTPSWQNGVAALMALKCAVCHRVPRPAISPRTVTVDLDLTLPAATGALRGAEETAPFLRAGILDQDVAGIPRMPLPYATPTTPAERAALETWAAGVLAAASAADRLYAVNCQECHGLGGTGRIGPDIRGVSAPNIGLAIANVPQMAARPWLAATTPAERQAISDFLQQPP